MSSMVRIAEQAGVSVATVSRVINRRPGISKDTVSLVHQAMKTLNYVPRPQDARPGPKTNINPKLQNGSIAFVIADKALDINATHTPFYSEILHGAAAELANNGLTMVYTVISDHNKMPVCLLGSKVDGLLLFHFVDATRQGVPEKTVDLVKRFASVTILGDGSSWCDHITYNNRMIGDLAANYLTTKGHKYIAQLATGTTYEELWLERDRTFQLAAAKKAEKVYVLDGSVLCRQGIGERETDEAIEKLVDEIARLNPRPTGIYTPLGHHAKPLYRILQRRGIMPGKDIEVVSVNKEPPLISGLEPRPAAVDLRANTIGQCAVKRLLWRIENPQEERMTMLLDPVMYGPDD